MLTFLDDDGLFWLNPIARVLLMLCSAVLVEWWLLKPCCVEVCGILFVMYGSSVVSSVFAINERSEMGLYDVHMFMSLFGYVVHVGEICESRRSYVLEVPDVDYNAMWHQTDTACSWLVCHSRGDCANCIYLPRLSGGPATQFFWEAPIPCRRH